MSWVVDRLAALQTAVTTIGSVRSMGAKKKNKRKQENKQKKQMLCLAYSWKHGGRCVAGLLPDGSWIRPVTATGDGSLAPSMCILDVGRPVRALDVVRVGVERPEPRLHQPENWVITDKKWKFVDSPDFSEVQDLLDRALTDEPELLGTKTNRVTGSQIRDLPPSSSLALVKVRRPNFVMVKSSNNREQRRARFNYRGVDYDLPMTFEFDLPRPGKGRHRSKSTWYLTISLGEPWEEQGGDCFKLVACALEAPS